VKGAGVRLIVRRGEVGLWRERGEVLWLRCDAMFLSTQVWSGASVRLYFSLWKKSSSTNPFVCDILSSRLWAD